MFFWNKICGLIALFLIIATCAYTQNESFNGIKKPALLKNKADSFYLNPLISHSNSVNKINKSVQIPPDFATCRYGFFCRQELKIEKAAKLPIRIRLGSLKQSNYYEGKQ